MPSDHDQQATQLRQEAARCVACGLCVPHCPTYRKTFNEADSPRGRIFMMVGLLEGRLPSSPELLHHLDLCLGCRACEQACPSKVAYGRLADGMRDWMSPVQPRLRKVLFVSVRSPRLLSGGAGLLRFYQRSGAQKLARRSGLLDRLGLAAIEAQLPAHHHAAPTTGLHLPAGTPHGTVGLFLGCVARIFDAQTLNAALFVLNRLGYAVDIPAHQGCCGALHQHNGDLGTADILRQVNLNAFAGRILSAIVHAASGCAASLAEYQPPLNAPIMDISTFLDQAEGWPSVSIAPLDSAVSVHESCASRNVLHDSQSAYSLLARIPNLVIGALAGNDQCCGAAGSYALTQPKMAGLLLRDKIEAVKTGTVSHGRTRIIVTSNPGCALHMAAGFRAEGMDVEVMHPVTLLAKQMGYFEVPNNAG
ncbi:MAG: (Fe-S)-binding protein [Sulfuricellaceae bacterium]|nr:(Fe-S)-binding protein [Sulfuricellaceae bacterium]